MRTWACKISTTRYSFPPWDEPLERVSRSSFRPLKEKLRKLAIEDVDMILDRTRAFNRLSASSTNSLHVCFDYSWHSKVRQPELGKTWRVGALSIVHARIMSHSPLTACLHWHVLPNSARLYTDSNRITVMIFIFTFEAVCTKPNSVNSDQIRHLPIIPTASDI